MGSIKGASSYIRSISTIQQSEIVLPDDSSDPCFTLMALSKS